jgi:H+/gluconate symporter-like permease
MSLSPIMSTADSRQLLTLAQASDTVGLLDASGGVAQVVAAQQLDDVRAQLREGETISVTA